MTFLKKLGISSYINIVCALVIFVSMILSIVSSSNLGYEIPSLWAVILMSIIGIIGIVASTLLSMKIGNKFVAYLPALVTAILSGICFFFVINARTELIGTVWVSHLDDSNPYAVGAINTGAPAFIMYCASMILIAIGSFFNLAKEEQK